MENRNFIRTIIEEDVKAKKHDRIATRFPPEPNGFLHLGHARSIIMNYTLAKDFQGTFNLRFDDTNPLKEDTLFIEAIKEDITWLQCPWDELFYASDYFDEMYARAHRLIDQGLAYVCDLSAEQIKETRGDLKTPGTPSPYRNRSIEENKALFIAMKEGQFPDGARVLRAKIDMASPNMNLRDPVIYRIQHAYHFNTKDAWCIYPMYDFAHPLEDAIEGITHSLCSLEFEDHRPLYDWCVQHTQMPKVPRQIEFGKLRIANEIMGKRYIKQLVDNGVVSGWDDPRLVTLSGLRKRGIPPQAIHQFIQALGLPKSQGETELEMLFEATRDVLGTAAPRVHAILDPIKVTLINHPGTLEPLDVPFHKDNEALGSRNLPFGPTLYIEREDFIEEKPNKKWKRWALGIEVRLMHAYFIKAESVVKNDRGEIVEIKATYDVLTKSGSDFNERKPNGTIHFVEASTAVPITVHLYDSLLLPDHDKDAPLESKLNPQSLVTLQGVIEPHLEGVTTPQVQFTRLGYFKRDEQDESVYHRIVPLKSSFK
jgi:glutaminyl-tRNA synthetase